MILFLKENVKVTKAITKNSKKGFTLVELVIVIAVLAILAAIAIPVVNSIVNAASRNAALTNASTIELAVKECQSHIATRNGEVYPEITTGKYNQLTINDVAEAKAIKEAFEMVTYNSEPYMPYWDKMNDKCVFLTSSDPTKGKELMTGEPYPVDAKYMVVLIAKSPSGEYVVATDTAKINRL
jgi:prepilin-type N-terminal cleavage/methylation domain-containing protein